MYTVCTVMQMRNSQLMARVGEVAHPNSGVDGVAVLHGGLRFARVARLAADADNERVAIHAKFPFLQPHSRTAAQPHSYGQKEALRVE
jgi:hypothetical protein